MEIRTLKDAEAELAKYIPAVKHVTGKDITLDRMWLLMEKLGNPQNELKIIHIAGTSGKTSTAYYIASLLQQSGQKVGLTVSPHVDSVTERLQINLEPLSEAEFCKALSEFLNLIKNVKPEPTYFELIIALMYWYFAQEKVDYAVVETGMGGLHDGTNVATRSDKLCVITDIGLDHVNILGGSLPKIATQKAGIIYPGNEVVCYRQSDDINQVITQICAHKQAKFHLVEPQTDDESADLPLFQQRNWRLAKAAYDVLVKRDELPELSPEQIIKAAHIHIPARMEEIVHMSQIIILDGSHNGQKLEALVTSMMAKHPDKSVAALVSFVSGEEKRIADGLEQLARLNPHLIITSFSGEQDTPKTSVKPEIVKEAAEKQGITSEIMHSPEGAFAHLLKRDEDILLVAGSFYLLNHIRPLIMTHHD